MTVHTYRVTGSFPSRDRVVHFRKEVRGIKESDAIEKIYSEIGSTQRLKRQVIKISKIEIIPLDEPLRDPFIQNMRDDKDIRIFIQ